MTAHEAYDGRPVWSPDGRWIAFASDRNGNDDVYVIPVAGGPVRRLTWHSDFDCPLDWTPDSRAVLFQSRRHLRDQNGWGLFLVPLEGGTAFPVLSTGGRLGAISPDGGSIAYVRGTPSWSRRGYEGNARARLWLCELTRPLLAQGEWPWSIADRAACESPSGCTSAGLLCEAALRPGGRHVNLTALGSECPPPFDAPDRNWLTGWDRGPDLSQPNVETGANGYPQWFPDGEHLLYLSESGGVCNLKVMSKFGGPRAWLTHYTGGRLRFPSLARNGRMAAYEFDDGICVVDIPRELPRGSNTEWPVAPSEPRRLRIRVPLDEPTDPFERRAVASGATELRLSPDGEQIAFVALGDIFAMRASKEEPAAYRLTDSPARDCQIGWAPDSKSLIFVSDREGNRDLYRLESADPDEPRLARALRHRTTRLTDDEMDEWSPQISPDGKWIAYLRGSGSLMLMEVAGSTRREILANCLDIEFTWSPDSRWLMYAVEDDDYNSDVWIVSTDGKTGPHNITRHPKDDTHPVWSPDGRMVAFSSAREFLNQVDIWCVWLTREEEEKSREARLEEYAGKKKAEIRAGDARDGAPNDAGASGSQDPWDEDRKPQSRSKDKEEDSATKKSIEVKIDFDDIHRRAHRLTTFPGSESQVLISENGSEFVFVASDEGQVDLWKVKWDRTEPTRLTRGGQNPSQIQWDPKLKEIFYLQRAGAIASVPLKGGETTAYPYRAEIEIDRAARRAAAFDEAWRTIRDVFYDVKMHGCDWTAARERYRGWALAASTQRDFLDVIRMMLGELNASHLDVASAAGDWGEDPVDLASPPDYRRLGAQSRDSKARAEAGSEASSAASSDASAEAGSEAKSETGSEARSASNLEVLPAKTGELGVIFDPRWHGDGLRILHVVKRTPAERVASRLSPGDVLLSVDGQPVKASEDIARLLDRTPGRRLLIEVRDAGGDSRAIAIEPDSTGGLRRALYEEELDLRRAYVHEKSGGRAAYTHIQSMGVPSLARYEGDLYAEASGRDALIIDVRDNSGGWTTDVLLTSLMAGDHATTSARGFGEGYPEDRRLLYAWVKPVVLLCNENSFSNAEIFSWALKTLHRAPVVGQRTFGGVISTGDTSLIDGSNLRLPTRGWWSKLDGSPLEGTGCVPDYTIENDPNDLARGVDRQLDKAVEVAVEQIR